MSAMGMFAAALGGAAGAINQQATGDIEQQRKTDLMQVAADLERSKLQFAETLRQGGVRADFNFANDKGTVAARQATARSNTLAAGQDTRDATVAAAGDTAYQGAVKGQADRDASDAAARERAKTKANAADGDYLGAMTKLTLADPRVAAAIARDRAAAGESGARTGLIGVQVEAGRVEIADKNKLNQLYDDASSILSDAKLTDEDRAKEFAKVQQKIVLMKSKNGTGTGARDPELDTQTEEVTRINPDGSTSKVTSKTVRKPGSIGADAGSASTPPPPEAVAMLAKNPELAAAFEAKYPGHKASAYLNSNAPAKSAAAKKAPDVETTTGSEGQTLYRFPGQPQWFKSRTEAIVALGRRDQAEDTGGFTQD